MFVSETKEIETNPSSLSRGPSRVASEEVQEFSLVCGGPLYQFLMRTGLVRPPLDRTAWRIGIITAVAWVPLLLLTAVGGRAVSGVRIPFLYDMEAQARMLLAIPLLIGAELAVHSGIRRIVLQFVQNQIITPAELPRFEACIHSALRLRNSVLAEVGLGAFIIIAGRSWWRSILFIHADTWYATLTGNSQTLTPAGYWYVLVSLPIAQFIAVRWYFRLFIWTRMLWQISRMDLNLVPTHPDGRCGLGFLGQAVLALAQLLMAHSFLLSGYVANRILYQRIKLPDHGVEILSVSILIVLMALGPLSVFIPKLLRARNSAVFTYGTLASEYINQFHKKWIQGQRPADEQLIGTGDIQSLADLANSFNVVQQIIVFPVDQKALIALMAIIVLPLLPLLLTMFSAQELAERALKVLF